MDSIRSDRRRRSARRALSAISAAARRHGVSALAAGLLATLAVAGLAYEGVKASEQPSEPGGPFELTDSAGRAVTDRSWPGKYLLIYFGYTYCPDVCPTTLSNLAGAITRIGPAADRIQPIFISVDPDRDTPQTLAAYVSAFTPRLVGLTGTADQIARVAHEYGVFYAREQIGPGPDDYAITHSSLLYLVAPDGHFVAPVTAALPPDEMADVIRRNLP